MVCPLGPSDEGWSCDKEVVHRDSLFCLTNKLCCFIMASYWSDGSDCSRGAALLVYLPQSEARYSGIAVEWTQRLNELLSGEYSRTLMVFPLCTI